MKREIKALPLNRLSFKMGITMLVLAIIMEIIKGSGGYDNAIQMMMVYYVMMVIIYLFGIVVLIILAVNISEAANVHKGYYIYSIVSTLILAFLWLPNFNILLSFGEISTLSNSPSLDGILGAGMSIYRGISDVGNLNMIMYVFFINGIIHWIIGYFVSPQPHQQKSVNMSNINTTIQRPRFDGIKGIDKDRKTSIDIKELYQCMNEKGIINRLDSKYWIYDVETFIRKENEINKKYLKIKFFNRFFNSEDDLMRIYLKINGEEIYEDFIQNIPEYDDDNIKGIIIERDLAEEIFEVEITGYIVNGSRENVNGKSISNIKLNRNEKLLSAIKERFFTDNKEKCKTIPVITENYWLCTCGYVNESEDGICKKCESQKELIKEISHFKEKDLLNNISEHITINTKQTVEEIIDDISKRYYEEYGISQETTYEAIDKEILERRQEELIDEEIERTFESRPIKFISGLSYSDNIEAYCRKNAYGIISADRIKEKINDEEWQQLYEENEKSSKKKLQKNKKVTLISFLVIIVFISLVVWNMTQRENDNNINTNENQYLNDQNIDDIDYIISDSNSRYLEDSELAELSMSDLRYARNEIYARHGYIFDDDELNKYFMEKEWYSPQVSAENWTDNLLNEYEKENIQIILHYESIAYVHTKTNDELISISQEKIEEANALVKDIYESGEEVIWIDNITGEITGDGTSYDSSMFYIVDELNGYTIQSIDDVSEVFYEIFADNQPMYPLTMINGHVCKPGTFSYDLISDIRIKSIANIDNNIVTVIFEANDAGINREFEAKMIYEYGQWKVFDFLSDEWETRLGNIM